MKICIPIQEDRGLASIPWAHFGSAGAYLVCDPGTMSLTTVVNREADHVHGMCNPVAAIEGTGAGAVIVGGIGPRAVIGLNAAGILVYRAVAGTVADNLDAFRRGALEEISSEGACSDGHGHGCG